MSLFFVFLQDFIKTAKSLREKKKKKKYYETIMPSETFSRVIPIFQLLEKESQSFRESLQNKRFGKTHMFRKCFDDI